MHSCAAKVRVGEDKGDLVDHAEPEVQEKRAVRPGDFYPVLRSAGKAGVLKPWQLWRRAGPSPITSEPGTGLGGDGAHRDDRRLVLLRAGDDQLHVGRAQSPVGRRSCWAWRGGRCGRANSKTCGDGSGESQWNVSSVDMAVAGNCFLIASN